MMERSADYYREYIGKALEKSSLALERLDTRQAEVALTVGIIKMQLRDYDDMVKTLIKIQHDLESLRKFKTIAVKILWILLTPLLTAGGIGILLMLIRSYAMQHRLDVLIRNSPFFP